MSLFDDLFGDWFKWKDKGGGSKGAPGPVAGVGLPFLAVAGIGYWLLRRRASVAHDKQEAVGGEPREYPTGADDGAS